MPRIDLREQSHVVDRQVVNKTDTGWVSHREPHYRAGTILIPRTKQFLVQSRTAQQTESNSWSEVRPILE
jgi:hypothetical protein